MSRIELTKIKARKLTRRDWMKMAGKVITGIMLLAGAYVAGHRNGIMETYAEANKQNASIRESFSQDGDFVLFGDYNIWKASKNPERCYSTAKRRHAK